MNTRVLRPLSVLLGLAAAFLASTTVGERAADPAPSAIVSESQALKEEFEWGTLYSYYQEDTYGTENILAAVATIKPGMEIHPPHEHTEEEYMLVTEGQGTWHLNGSTQEARAGDMMYAAPWDVHGITNTGTTPLTFVVWKWNTKGMPLPEQPAEE